MVSLNANPAVGFVRSQAELRRRMGKGPLFDWMKLDSRDFIHFHDDFLVDTINLDNYALANGGGAAVSSFAATASVNGTIQASTGTAGNDTASANLITPAFWFGDQGAACEFRYKISAITEVRFEAGFVDVVPGTNKSVVNALTTPTVNTAVVDAAVFVFDHATATTTSELVTIGAGGFAAAKTAWTTNRPVAATYQTVRIQLLGDRVKCWVDGSLMADHAAQSIEGGNPVAFWARLSASSAAARTCDIDYIRVWQERL